MSNVMDTIFLTADHQQRHNFDKKQKEKYIYMWSFRRIDTVIAVVAGIGVGAFLFELAAAGGAARVPRRPQANTLL